MQNIFSQVVNSPWCLFVGALAFLLGFLVIPEILADKERKEKEQRDADADE